MRKMLFILFYLSFLACQHSKTDSPKNSQVEKSVTSAGKKDFTMYEMSEMALLMEQMYVDNQRLRDKISNGELPGDFPDHFMKIHLANMTDPSENDAFFQKQAKLFIEAQKQIYEDPDKAREHYNEAIKLCIQCHEVKCGGPIPRIKKLLLD